MADSDIFHSCVAEKKSLGLIYRLIVIRLVLCIGLTVLCVIFSMWVALTHLFGLGLIVIQRAILGLC